VLLLNTSRIEFWIKANWELYSVRFTSENLYKI